MAFINAIPLPFKVSSIRVSPASQNYCTRMTLNVLVSGSLGRTGRIVFQKLSSDPTNFTVTGLARDLDRATEIFGNKQNLIDGDVTKPETLDTPMAGKDALVILSSSIPKLIARPENAPPVFEFAPGGMPEHVDWLGAKNQIDAAIKFGVKHVVIVGSMGSTEENNMLNRIGNGNILRFKRKSELYLIESGMPYTVINPGGLLNEPEGERELVVGHNDELFSVFERADCGIPRADVARVVVAALLSPHAKNKALDVVGRPKGEGTITKDVAPLFEKAGSQL